ncbi:AbiH family protein [Erysipelothrix rhusiopathiae]|nr:AbiH family protein [Erysipelothrix rhusiopathiae]
MHNNTLIIIGNGFDLHHGLKTQYSDFFSSYYEEQSVAEFQRILAENVDLDLTNNWLDIEELIAIARKESALEETDQIIRNNTEFTGYYLEFSKVIEDLKIQFRNYLLEIYKPENIEKNLCLQEIFKPDNLVVNFNYTNTVQDVYGIECIHPHGSLEENFIILGHGLESIPHNFVGGHYDRYNKDYLRDELIFIRGLKYNNYSSNQIEEAHNYYVQEISINRGVDGHGAGLIVKNNSKLLEYGIKAFIEDLSNNYKSIPFKFGIPKDKLKSVDTLIVLGHSIKADKDFFEGIDELCDIREVIVYSHNKELQEEIERINTLRKIYGSARVITRSYLEYE